MLELYKGDARVKMLQKVIGCRSSFFHLEKFIHTNIYIIIVRRKGNRGIEEKSTVRNRTRENAIHNCIPNQSLVKPSMKSYSDQSKSNLLCHTITMKQKMSISTSRAENYQTYLKKKRKNHHLQLTSLTNHHLNRLSFGWKFF